MRRSILLALACAALVCCGSDPTLASLSRADDAVPTSGAALYEAHPRAAAYAIDGGWVIHGVAVTQQALERWAPTVTFHPQEKYLPYAIEDLLRDATVRDSSGQVVRYDPSQSDLQRLRHMGYHIELDPAAYHGTPADGAKRVHAPMYASAQVPADGAFVDLNYIFLMGFNGSQTGVLRLFGRGTELLLPHFADHQGDIEAITVRVSPDLSQVLMVRFEGHGHSEFVKPADVQFDGTHAKVISALNSHANYNARAFPRPAWHMQARVSALGFGLDVVDITDASGPTWAPNRVLFVGLDDNDAPLSEQTWVAFAGRLGATWDNKFTGVRRLDGSLPNVAIRVCSNTLVNSAIALGKTGTLGISVGPLGLAARDLVRVTQPCWTPPADF